MNIKNIFWKSVLSLIMTITLNAGAINITINDGVGIGNGWYSASNENQEVEPNNIASQIWDMESFNIDLLSGGSVKLTMIGGYNFTTPVGLDGFRPGDLFIDHNGDLNYDYVAVIGNAPNSYDVYTLGTTYSVFYGQNSASNPWRYNSGGTLAFSNQQITYSSFSDVEGIHYQASLNMNWLFSSITNGSVVTFHNTMECGNDNLMGQYTYTRGVPDINNSQYFLGIGLLFMLGCRKFVS